MSKEQVTAAAVGTVSPLNLFSLNDDMIGQIPSWSRTQQGADRYLRRNTRTVGGGSAASLRTRWGAVAGRSC